MIKWWQLFDYIRNVYLHYIKSAQTQNQMESSVSKNAILASLLTAANPLELIKLRIQTSLQLDASGKANGNYGSIRQCATSIIKTEGIRSFWKGNTLSLIRFFPNESINLQMRSFLSKQGGDSALNKVIGAMVSGWTSSFLLYPFEVLRQSVSTSMEKKCSLLNNATELVKTRGIKYFYKGFLNSLLGTAAFRGSFNGSFDTMKNKANSLSEKALIAYLCSIFAAMVCYPLEVVNKRRIFVDSRVGAVKFGIDVWRSQGFKGLYKGYQVLPLQALTGAVILMLFDTSKNN